MSDPVQPARFHGVIFKTVDPSEVSTKVVFADVATIQANVPAGGCWRLMPKGKTRASEAGALGGLAEYVEPVRPVVSTVHDPRIVTRAPRTRPSLADMSGRPKS